jgi:hypothetical protein
MLFIFCCTFRRRRLTGLSDLFVQNIRGIIAAATRILGEFIHKAIPDADRFGIIAPGNRADLLRTSRNPLMTCRLSRSLSA